MKAEKKDFVCITVGDEYLNVDGDRVHVLILSFFSHFVLFIKCALAHLIRRPAAIACLAVCV